MNLMLVGCGKMGGYHLNAIRNFDIIKSISVVEPGSLSKDLMRNEIHFSSLEECLSSRNHDIAVIASPTSTHEPVLEKVLAHTNKILVEKPISDNKKTAKRFSDRSEFIAVGHIERFNPVIESLATLLKGRNIDSCDFYRLSSFPRRITDVGVDLDLSIHDLDLVRFMFGNFDIIDRSKQLDDQQKTVDAKYKLEVSGIPVTIHSSWLHKEVDRKIVVKSNNDLIIADLVNKVLTVNSNPIKINTDGPDQLTKQFKSFLSFIGGENAKICKFYEAILALEAV